MNACLSRSADQDFGVLNGHCRHQPAQTVFDRRKNELSPPRQLPAAPDPAALARLAGGEIDVAVITSSEGLRNLLALGGDRMRATVLATPLVVMSARQAQAARALGFHAAVEVAARADDTAILAAVRAWQATRNSL